MASSSASASTLQSSLDDVHSTATAPSSKAGSTDMIRIMLREQKRECATLHANPLFKEFRDRQKKTHRVVPGQDAPAPVIDDLEAEGQTRLIDLIKSAAAERDAAPAGVWASFSKPYACLGELEQLDGNFESLLPRLNRDELHSSQQQHRPTQRSSNHGLHTGAMRPATAAAAAAAAAGDNSAGAAGAAAGGSSREQQEARLLRHKTITKFSTLDRIEASFPVAAVTQADARRKAAKTHPNKFFNKSLAESDLKDAAASYGKVELQFKQLPGHLLVAHHQAAAAAAEAAAAAHAEAAAAALVKQVAGGADSTASKTSVFLTQRATAAHCSSATADAASLEQQQQQLRASCAASEASMAGGCYSRGRSQSPGHRIAILATGEDRNSVAAAAAAASRRSTVAVGGRSTMVGVPGPRASVSCMASSAQHHSVMYMSGTGLDLGTSAADAEPSESACSTASGVADRAVPGLDMQPTFKVLTELTVQQQGVVNPVIDWHNEFVKARQAGYTALQSTLLARSQARAAARSQPTGRAQLNASLMQHLEALGGKLAPGYTQGIDPESPYAASSKVHSITAAAGAEGQSAPGTRPVKQSEVELLEQFYDALCGLVERQRLSDPLSLMVVHQVKALLEGGTFLQPALLQQVIEKVADFVKSCGLIRYNCFALPLLAFIRKCVGVSQVELESMSGAAGISQVLFEHYGEVNTTTIPAAAATLATAAATAAAAATVVVVGRGSGDESTAAAAAACISSTQGIANGLAAEASCNSVPRCSSRLGSDSGAILAAAAIVPPIPIDAAAAAAAADIKQAVHSAPASQRAAGTGTISSSSGPGKPMQVRVPGVAGHVEVEQGAAAGPGSNSRSTATGPAGSLPMASQVPQLDLCHYSAQAVPDEPLPDLGDDCSGQPLSRRARQLEGMKSWSGSQSQQQQQQQQCKAAAAAALRYRCCN